MSGTGFLQPTTLNDAVALRAERPDALPLAGGTDVMVQVNQGVLRPDGLMDLTRIPELLTIDAIDHAVRIGAAVPYTRIELELAVAFPGLAMAARTVGSRQIRNLGTIGGNLGTASPAGDSHPILLALGGSVNVASVRGLRAIAVGEFFLAPRKTALAADELIVSIDLPARRGPQYFSKVGPRNSMVIAIASFALVIDPEARHVGTGIGSAGPTPLPATAAERLLVDALDGLDAWDHLERIDRQVSAEFGSLVAAAARPIDDLRGTADYRRHALSVVARRALTWAGRNDRLAGIGSSWN